MATYDPALRQLGLSMTPSDWLLLSVDLAHPKPVQPVQLQKCLFLLDRKLSPAQKCVERIYAFTPYDYGPFDSAVYQDAEALALQGLLSITRPIGTSYKQYAVTQDGHGRAAELRSEVAAEVVAYAHRLVAWTQGLTFNQLVAAVYSEFPEMKVNSVFKG